MNVNTIFSCFANLLEELGIHWVPYDVNVLVLAKFYSVYPIFLFLACPLEECGYNGAVID